MSIMPVAGREIRNSGIELLKIIAVVMIVVGHVISTLSGSSTDYISNHDFILDVSVASTNIQCLIMAMLKLGTLSNDIFFVCSAWFLLDSNQWSKRKWYQMLTEIWAISVIIFAIFATINANSLSEF